MGGQGLLRPPPALGAAGESSVKAFEACGLEIVDCNFCTRYKELDLVARDECYLVFCEVKTRIVRGCAGPAGAAGRHRGEEAAARTRDGTRVAERRPRPPRTRLPAGDPL